MSDPEGYIFGYGSLINPQSIAKTLQESADVSMNEPSVLRNFERSWSLEERVFVEGKKREELMMVFLNIKARQGHSCNGVIFPVSRENLFAFDKRERRYSRLDVSRLVSPKKDLPVYTYVGKDAYIDPPASAFVSELYEEIVECGLEYWGEAFRMEYHTTTLPHIFRRTREHYTFDPVD